MANNQPPVASVPVNIPPLENFEEVRQVLTRLVSAINAALGALPATSFNGQRLTRIGSPVSVDDAATKGYVDDAAASTGRGGSIWGTSSAFPLAINVVPKSGGGGRLVPSSGTDNGTSVKWTEPLIVDEGSAAGPDGQFLAQASSAGAASLFCIATDNAQVAFDFSRSGGTNTARHTTIFRIIKNGSILQFQGASGQTIGSPVGAFTLAQVINASGSCGFGGNAAPGFAVDITGDCNVSGVYRKSGVAGHGTTVTYVNAITTNSVGDVTGISFGTSTYSGGIFVGNT